MPTGHGLLTNLLPTENMATHALRRGRCGFISLASTCHDARVLTGFFSPLFYGRRLWPWSCNLIWRLFADFVNTWNNIFKKIITDRKTERQGGMEGWMCVYSRWSIAARSFRKSKHYQSCLPLGKSVQSCRFSPRCGRIEPCLALWRHEQTVVRRCNDHDTCWGWSAGSTVPAIINRQVQLSPPPPPAPPPTVDHQLHLILRQTPSLVDQQAQLFLISTTVPDIKKR